MTFCHFNEWGGGSKGIQKRKHFQYQAVDRCLIENEEWSQYFHQKKNHKFEEIFLSKKLIHQFENFAGVNVWSPKSFKKFRYPNQKVKQILIIVCWKLFAEQDHYKIILIRIWMFSKEMICSKYDISNKDFSKRRKHMSSSEPELLFKRSKFQKMS